MERKLASIQIIEKLEPIQDADRILKAFILGWQVVVRKDEFKEGDKCVFFEIDSMMPNKPEFEFLKSPDKDYAGKEFVARLKTKKLKGVISQGLAMPTKLWGLDHVVVGEDVTDYLGIVKYEPPESVRTGGMLLGSFPVFIPKTDEQRIQSYPALLDEIRGLNVYVTTKMDGTSVTYYLEDGALVVCSRNNKIADGDNVYWAIAKKLDIENKIKEMPYKVALQGEVCGPGVQKNTANLTELSCLFFNIYNIEKHQYISYPTAKNLIDYAGLSFVPIDIPYVKFVWTLPELLEMAKGKYPNSKHNREGIVIRPITERYSCTLQGRLSFKVINNDYLLKGEN